MSAECAGCGADISHKKGAKYCSRECARANGAGIPTTHGLSKHPLFSTWCGIRSCCCNRDDPSYKNHGGHGIKMYGPWIDDPAAFITWVEENLGPRPSRRHSLVRRDSDGDYAPGNLRWARPRRQNRRAQANGGRDRGAGGKLRTSDRSTAMMIVCAGCGSRFVPTRSDAQYCSPPCRQRAYRARRAAS